MDVRVDPFYKVQSVIAPRVFTSQVPASFSAASPGYEVATQFSSSIAGTAKALRFYRAPGEAGNNIAHLWSDRGTLLPSSTFVDHGHRPAGRHNVPIVARGAITADPP